jgi:urease accessory protein
MATDPAPIPLPQPGPAAALDAVREKPGEGRESLGLDLALIRLLHLASPALPIGMYSYSQGMERAVEDGWIADEAGAGNWIAGLMERGQARTDLPILARLHAAWAGNDLAAVEAWSRTLHAFRETAELRAEDRQTGQALARLLDSLGMTRAAPWVRHPAATLATAFGLAAAEWGISGRDAAAGYLWSWLENQVLCAVKLVPLGQVAGQRLLLELSARIPALVETAAALPDDEIGGSVFGLALASSRHEMQYSRLFRS